MKQPTTLLVSMIFSGNEFHMLIMQCNTNL